METAWDNVSCTHILDPTLTLTLDEAPVSISMISSGWLGLLSITLLVFSRTLFWISAL